MEEKKKVDLKIIILIVAVLIIAIVEIAIFIKQEAPTKMTKEQMLEVAKELDFKQLSEDVDNNMARVKEEYEGNIYKYSFYIEEINEDYVELGGFKVYLIKDELITLSKGEKITVVGEVNKIDVNEDYKTRTVGRNDDCSFIGEMKNAYLVSKTFNITGTFRITDSSIKSKGYKDYSINTINEEYVHANEKLPDACFYIDKSSINKFNEFNEIKQGDKIEVIGTLILFTVQGYTSIEIQDIQSIMKANE